MASFADITIRFGADLKQFSSQIQNAQRDLNRMGKNLQNIGAGLTLGLTTPLVGLGALALNAAADFETLNTSLLTVFQGNEQAAKQAFDQITEFTAQTPFQLEEVAQGFIKLKNLGLDPGIDSLRSYGNTASALGKTLDQFIEAVADASVNEFERLKEFGIKASQEGEKVAFTFQGVTTTVGKNAEEITAFLQELGNTTFAGGIERQAQTFNGVMSTLRDNLKLLAAEFGDIIIDGVKPLLGFVQDIIAGFRELSPETKKWIVILGGVAAAVGPLLALAGTILPAIGTGLTLLSGPIGLVVAGLTAIGVVIYKNWEPIKETLLEITQYFQDLYKESVAFRVVVEAITFAFKSMYEVGRFAVAALGKLFSALGQQIKAVFINIGDIVEAIFKGNFAELSDLLKKATTDSIKLTAGFVQSLDEDFQNLKTNTTINLKQGIADALQGNKYDNLTTNIKEAVKKGFTEGLKEGADTGTQNGGPFTPQTDRLNLETPGIAQVGDLNIKAKVLETLQLAEMSEALLEWENRLLEFQERTGEILEGAIENFAIGFGNLIGEIAQGNAGLGDVGALLLRTMADIITQLGESAIQLGVTMKAIKLSFSSPAAAIAAGIGLVAFGAILRGIASQFAGNFSTGGIVGGTSFAGDKLLAGVNSGELILNIAQQKNLAGALSAAGTPIILRPTIDFSMDKFRVGLDYENNKRDRLT